MTRRFKKRRDEVSLTRAWQRSVGAGPIRVRRLRVVQVGLYAIACILAGRLVQIQVVKHEVFAAMAVNQHYEDVKLPARRGLILDRKFEELVLNKLSYDIGLYLRFFEKSPANIKALADALNVKTPWLRAKIAGSDKYVPLVWRVEESVAQAVEALDMPAVIIHESSERIYPFNETLGQVLGFVGLEGKGLSGLEFTYDEQLRGRPGRTILRRDATGKSLMAVQAATHDPVPGHNLILSVDYVAQTIAEEELLRAVETYRAKGGSVVITNPSTGEVLAIASVPSFNANRLHAYTAEDWRIRPITDIFEPGSTFKIVTMMAALTEGYDPANDIFFCENGKYQIYGHTIEDSEPFAWLSFKNVFKKSSNIGTAKIAQDLGKEALFRAARDFGFGNKTDIGLIGEVDGILKKPTEWSNFSVAAISYGYEVAVTAIQMTMAYGAVANGGLLMKPLLVKEVIDHAGETVVKKDPQVIRRVMHREAANAMARILEEAVTEGTGTEAAIPGLRIAGKTGTAKKPAADRPGYSSRHFVASFVGFYPADHPRLLIHVMIDEPYPVHSGGSVAAPTFRRILQRIDHLYDPPPVQYTQHPKLNPTAKTQAIKAPDLRGRTLQTATRWLMELDIPFRLQGDGLIVVDQAWQAEPQGHNPGLLLLTLANPGTRARYTQMPDLIGRSLREAVTELAMRNLQAKVMGSGRVIRQDPEPGAKIRSGAHCLLEAEWETALLLERHLQDQKETRESHAVEP